MFRLRLAPAGKRSSPTRSVMPAVVAHRRPAARRGAAPPQRDAKRIELPVSDRLVWLGGGHDNNAARPFRLIRSAPSACLPRRSIER
jgi:hypothetical protein